ncbi:substrate-binding periplasmic protein [Simiduia agarivorans]|uniref:Extracellular solute-binding protein n=1 Tax=Simiduia agarivorans (strain DSM 21679 / JCM 13881 / BCRC 17597 / SA1) TaxID=1117647 RepID=K4KN49_SIMAS|nr:transporter substrate-binding domain-containing protein [Simiduia agarivorans]AFV00605.1 extracellular solute-binding protein [Simiduia agarivorans SA1 = DSM 21679]
MMPTLPTVKSALTRLLHWTAAIMLLQFANAARAQTATVCIDHYPPFTYFVNNKAQGAMIDALKMIADEVGFSLAVSVNTAFARCLRMMQAGKMDLMVSLMPTPERLEYMTMFAYSEPEALRMVARADFDGEPETALDILRLRVGLINGYEYPPEFERHPMVIQAPQPEAGLRLLDARRIDILVLNESVAAHLVDQAAAAGNQRTAIYKLLKATFLREQNVNSIGVAKASWLHGRKDQIGASIARLRAAGEFERLIEKHQIQLRHSE